MRLSFSFRRLNRKRGLALIYVVIIFTALLGFVSLGVDLGRVQLAKTQLAGAADAAARYASTGISDGTYLAKAQAVAAQNSVDGVTLSLQSGDVVKGTWAGGAFTAGGSSPNAIRIMAVRTAQRGDPIPLVFGQMIGLSSIDINATSIALVANGPPSYSFAGLSSINISGNWIADSYNSSVGAYKVANRRTNATMATNGNANVNGSSYIYGDLYYRSGYSSNNGAGPVAPHTAKILATSLQFPNPVLPASYTSMGNFNGNSGSSSLATGNYYYQSFNVNSGYTLKIKGQVNIYVGGNVSIGGTINTLNNLPANLKIYTVQSSGVNISGSSSLYASIYAPNSPINWNSSGQFYGSAIGSQISISGSGSSGWHYDESLSTAGNSGVITTVY